MGQIDISVGQKYIIPGMDKNFMPDIAKVEVIEVGFTIRPILNRFDEDVRVRFKDGREETISGMSLRRGGRLVPPVDR